LLQSIFDLGVQALPAASELAVVGATAAEDNVAVLKTNTTIHSHLQMICCLVHLVRNFFNHHSLPHASKCCVTHQPFHQTQWHAVIAANPSQNTTHLRFDLRIHVKRNVLEACNTLADLIQLLVQFPDIE
jgi:hypothetical protein